MYGSRPRMVRVEPTTTQVSACYRDFQELAQGIGVKLGVPVD